MADEFDPDYVCDNPKCKYVKRSMINGYQARISRMSFDNGRLAGALMLARVAIEQGQSLNAPIAANGPTIGEVIDNAISRVGKEP